MEWLKSGFIYVEFHLSSVKRVYSKYLKLNIIGINGSSFHLMFDDEKDISLVQK